MLSLLVIVVAGVAIARIIDEPANPKAPPPAHAGPVVTVQTEYLHNGYKVLYVRCGETPSVWLVDAYKGSTPVRLPGPDK